MFMIADYEVAMDSSRFAVLCMSDNKRNSKTHDIAVPK